MAKQVNNSYVSESMRTFTERCAQIQNGHTQIFLLCLLATMYVYMSDYDA